MDKKKTKNKKNREKRERPSLYTIIVLLAVAVIILIILIVIINNIILKIKYKKYTEKMYEYGYQELYDNQEASTLEKLTNKELIKVIIGSIKNSNDIDELNDFDDSTISSDEKWYNYATYLGYNTVIDKDEIYSNAKKVDAAIILTNIVEKALGVNIEKTKLEMSDKKLSKFDDNEKDILSKAVSLGLIENNNKGISNKEIIKGELNKLVISVIEKYSTIYYANKKTADGGTLVGNIVTDKSKMPNNFEDYPYIVDNIDNSLYDIELNYEISSNAKTPKMVYSNMSDIYLQIDEIIENYFDAILNVDYNNISADSFIDKLNGSTIYSVDKDDVIDYIKYVKSNKIKLEGKATALLPIIYYSGEQYIVRTKVVFKVINSNTNKNLLYGDENSNIIYNSNQFELYVDLPMGITINSKSLLVRTDCIAENMIKANNSIVIED